MREIHILVLFLLSLPIFHIAFIIEEATGSINEEAVGAKAQANPPCCIFISCFSVSVAISIIRPDFSSDLTILIISSLSSFEMNKENLLPALTTPHPVFSSLSKTEKDALVAYLGKMPLAKRRLRSINVFFP